MDEIREKIEKLLVLSGSSNEHEAKAALLKAQELMYKYNIENVGVVTNQEVVTLTVPMMTTKIKEYAELPTIIARNFRCLVYYNTRGLQFLGFEDDAYAAVKCMEFMVDEITRGFDDYYKRIDINKRIHMHLKEIKPLKKEWIRGFTMAIKDAFSERAADPRYEIMLSVPDEVRRVYSRLSFKNQVPYSVKVNEDAYNEGYMIGKRAVRNKRIEE